MKADDLRFFDPRGEIAFSANRLPHWQQAGGVYFVTFRLADSLPNELLRGWMAERETWLCLHPLPWSAAEEREHAERFFGAVERWLDAGHGACVLGHPECAAEVGAAFAHFDGMRYDLVSWAVMPNHVHVVVRLYRDQALERVLHSWKRFASLRINALLGGQGRLWQRDYFDRLVRDREHFNRCVRYIRRNPEKARLCLGRYLLYESELARQVE